MGAGLGVFQETVRVPGGTAGQHHTGHGPIGCLSLRNRKDAQEGRGGRQQDRHHQLAHRQGVARAYSNAKHAVE